MGRLLGYGAFVFDWLFGAVKEFGQDNCSQLAAGISYYVLFSIFPLLIFSVGIIGLVAQDQRVQDDLVNAVMENIPLSQEQGRNDVANAINDIGTGSSGAIGVIGLLTMAWSGSNMFGSLRRSLNLAYNVEAPRPLLRQKFIDLGLVLAFAPFFLGSIAATTALRVAQRASGDIPVLGHLAQEAGSLWLLASLAVPLVISFAAFLFLYWLVPARRYPLRYVIPSALLAALLFEFGKLAFSIYLENFSNYDVVFGSLGAVIAFMFWVYLSANILLFGAELVEMLPIALVRRHEPKPEGPKPSLRSQAASFLRGLVFRNDEPESDSPD